MGQLAKAGKVIKTDGWILASLIEKEKLLKLPIHWFKKNPNESKMTLDAILFPLTLLAQKKQRN